MAGYYVVKQGEHLSGLASAFGFASYEKIWDHPNNSAFKAQRQDPNVLFPGDQLFIPDREEKDYDRPTDDVHEFRVFRKPLFLRMTLDRLYAQPIADTPCELSVDGDKLSLTSDGSGLVEHKISTTAVSATLVVKDRIAVNAAEVPLDIRLPLKIGYLDPVEEVSGQAARLSNLGYYRAGAEEIDEDEFLSAVEEFQCEHNLQVDGICGPLTQAALKQVHGS